MNTEYIQQLIESGQLIEAKKCLYQGDALDCTEIEVLCLKTAIAVEEGEFLLAEQYLIEGIGKESINEDLLFNMGIVQQILGHFERAIYYYDQLMNITNDTILENIIKQKISECNEQLAQIKRPLVSIVLLAYNKLEYTMMCVESIFKHTTHIDFELIAVNNGSTDATLDYFNGLPEQTRPLHLPINQGVVGGFNEGMKIARGKYTAAVCNDFIFTPRWLDNLLICIESDEKIGYVSPGASMISNYQQIPCEYKTIDDLYDFAEKYNHSDPLKWEERLRLLPCVLLARTELLEQVGYYDTDFYYGEFADDDISFKIRRAGYKLVYCKDTFTHHFGSVTVAVDQINNQSMSVSRKIFHDKYGFDAWDVGSFHPIMLESLSVDEIEGTVNILGVNSSGGSNPLQLKNILRAKGIKDVTITNHYLNPIYKTDLLTVSDHLIYGDLDSMVMKLSTDDHKYSFIITEIETEMLQNNISFIYELKQLLKKNGQIACRFIYKELNEEAMAADIEVVKIAGFDIRRTKIDRNLVEGYDVLITAQWRD